MKRFLLYQIVSLFLLLTPSCAKNAGNAIASPTTASTKSISLLIRNITIIHPEKDSANPVQENMDILVQDRKILAIETTGKTFQISEDTTVIDGTGKWIVPGLIDSHVHFFQSANPYTRPDVADFTGSVPYKEEVERNQARLEKTFALWLANGVTAVADVGGPFWNFTVRDLSRKNPKAPFVAVAGPLVSLVDRPALDLGDPPIIKVSSKKEAVILVGKLLEKDPDFVKIWFIHRSGNDLAEEEDIVKTACARAHQAGVRVAIHATELEVAKAALRAGADILVHSVFDKPIDEEFLSLAKNNNAIYVPTIFVRIGYGLVLSKSFVPTEIEKRLGDPEILNSIDSLPKPVRQKPNTTPPRVVLENLKQIWDAGITVAMGTDAGNIGTLHGPSVFREMTLMQEAGLTPLEVLRSATINGAMLLGKESEMGTIKVGNIADLLIVDKNPLENVNHLSQGVAVIKTGEVFWPEQLIQSLQ